MFVESTAYSSKAMSQQGSARVLNLCFAACSWCEEHAEMQAVKRVVKAVFCWNAWIFNLCIIVSVSTHQNMEHNAVQPCEGS